MGTHRVFGDLELAWIEDTIAPGDRYMPTARGLEDTFGGLLEVRAAAPRGGLLPPRGDVAQGRDTQADWTVLSVLRGDTGASRRSPLQVGPRRPRIPRLCLLDRTSVQYRQYHS